MKFNLKNRPKIPSFYDQRKTPKQIHDEMLHDLIKCFTWFEGFEKQLHEYLEAEKQNHNTAKAMPDCALREDLLSHSWGRIQLLKQILGDEK